MNTCVFCKIIKEKISSDKIDETNNFIVIKDINPVSEGHCLIISKKHYETLFDIPSGLNCELIDLVKKQGKNLINEKIADGIKIVINNYESSGQVVKHFHLHIIPEKKGVIRKKHV